MADGGVQMTRIARVAKISMSQLPSNKDSMLINRFLPIIKRSSDLRYNILWVYGGFLEDVPKRLGTNHALDAAVSALTAAHADYCLHFQERSGAISVGTLQLYGNAMRAMRTAVGSTATAFSPETLCAIYLLLICQSFIGHEKGWAEKTCLSSHSVGALQILRQMNSGRTQDEFEKALILSMRGHILIESLLNSHVQLTTRELQDFLRYECDVNSLEGQMWRSLSNVPDLINWARKRQELGIPISAGNMIRTQAIEGYHEALRLVKVALEQLSAYEGPSRGATIIPSSTHLRYQRSYGLSLLAVMVWICVLKNIDSASPDLQWDQDARFYTWQILDLAVQSHPYRPIGTCHMLICLLFAYAAVDDSNLQMMVATAFEEFRTDSPWMNPLKREDFDAVVSPLRRW